MAILIFYCVPPKNTYITDIFNGETAKLPKMAAHLSDIMNIKAEFHVINVNCAQYPDDSCLKVWLKDYCQMSKQVLLFKNTQYG